MNVRPTSQLTPANDSSVVRAIVAGGLGADALDLIHAFAFHGARGITPESHRAIDNTRCARHERIRWRSSDCNLGAALRFSIALIPAALFVAATRKIGWLTSKAAIAGVPYGAHDAGTQPDWLRAKARGDSRKDKKKDGPQVPNPMIRQCFTFDAVTHLARWRAPQVWPSRTRRTLHAHTVDVT